MNPARLALRPLGPTTWRRWVYLVLGGAVFTPYLVVGVYPSLLAWGDGTGAIAAAAAGGLLMMAGVIALTAMLEAVRQLEVVAAKQLLRGPLVAELIPASVSGADRVRAGAFFALHLVCGGLVGVGTIIVLPSGVTFLLGATGLVNLSGDSPWQGQPWPAMGLLGIGCLAVFAYGTASLGALMSWAAPRLLGRSSTARLAEMERVTGELSERNRLARDLHDSVGHALSVVAVQAGAARKLIDADPEFARESLAAVEAAASQALADLDGALATLRDEGPPGHRRTLTDIDSLVSQSAAAGLVIDTELAGPIASLPEPLSSDAFMVVQEALGNALRHAGPVPVSLRITVEGGVVRLHVSNPVPPVPAAPRPSGGRGLRWMAERARSHGGAIEAREVGGLWTVDATMRASA
ncbi:sensor histidine kinase [Aeromicrobium sp. Root344]|uniref:sensor histidine kinase n=1 Tax=Aeromicrobium sp. Root344 TaxID=1736521 RepID=UPI000B319E3B|nr:histidine kinase [Aeromicrobium sp. Root344]